LGGSQRPISTSRTLTPQKINTKIFTIYFIGSIQVKIFPDFPNEQYDPKQFDDFFNQPIPMMFAQTFIELARKLHGPDFSLVGTEIAFTCARAD
jgi:hypothetical protein